MAKNKDISARLRAVYGDLLKVAADAAQDRRYERVMASMSESTTSLWQGIAEAEAAEAPQGEPHAQS